MKNTFVLLLNIAFLLGIPIAAAAEMEFVRVDAAGRGFELAESNLPFRVWGVNYDRDSNGRLIEDYWIDEWTTVEQDFSEIKELGANVVRIHLQFGRFMKSAGEPSASALRQLERLLVLAERNGLYLDLTGLGCYHKADVPEWYDQLTEAERWGAQAAFWEAIASTCRESPAVFCYDLMNEPVVPGSQKRNDWLGPAFAGSHFVQFVTLDLNGRERVEVARQWMQSMVAAVRKVDHRHLITVGLVDWSLDRPRLTSGFVPDKIAPLLDFVAVHIYPESHKLEEATKTIQGFQLGKPVVIEEIYPLKCSPRELKEFIDSEPNVAGWIGFYWGETAAECRARKTIGGSITADWLEFFATRAKN